MTNKARFSIIAGVMVLLGAIGLFAGGIGYNEDQNWQVIQSVRGNIEVRDIPGWYPKWFATVWTWPRAHQTRFGDEGEISVTFNDGGTANLNGTLRYRLPVDEESRRVLHREFSGNIDNVDAAIMSHLVNAIKVTGPVMSASENQSARKSDFTNLVRGQLENGLYRTVKVERELHDQFDESGNPITVFATEIVTNESGQYEVAQQSPLNQYGIQVVQFSIENTTYDPKTRELFNTKKEAFLRAEEFKAKREEQVQQRLMVVEQFEREKAEVEGEANKEKARRTIEAEMEVAVAAQQALQAEEIKRRQTTEADARRVVAELDLAAERLNAEAVRVAAAAEEERILKAGAITERDRVLAEIEANARVKIGTALANVKVPSVMFIGGENANGNGAGLQDSMMNLLLLQATGIMDQGKRQVSPDQQ
jgi:hypothetical protein